MKKKTFQVVLRRNNEKIKSMKDKKAQASISHLNSPLLCVSESLLFQYILYEAMSV